MPARYASRWLRGAVAADEDTLLMYPGDHRLGDGLPVALVGVGAGSQETAGRARHLLEVAADGYLLVSGDFSGIDTFGNDAAIARIQATLDWVRAQGYGTSDPVVTIGFSMGTTDLLAWARTKTSADVVKHFSIQGLFDLDDLHANDRSGFASRVDSAFGGAYDDAVHGPTHSPVRYADEIAWLPVTTWYSEVDAITVPAAEAAFAAAHGNTTRNSLGSIVHGAAFTVMDNRDIADAV